MSARDRRIECEEQALELEKQCFELLAQRDALLKACEALLDHMAGDVEIDPDHPVVQGVYIAAKNAGAKVREPYMYGLKGKPE